MCICFFIFWWQGNDDPHAICSWGAKNISYIDPETKIPYAGNQINKDKKGCNPDNFYLPDYGYYHRIDELNFEYIGLEESVSICPSDFGDQNFKDCNDSSKIGCAYLGIFTNIPIPHHFHINSFSMTQSVQTLIYVYYFVDI